VQHEPLPGLGLACDRAPDTIDASDAGDVLYLIADGRLRVLGGQEIEFLQELGLVASIDNAAFNPRGDLACALTMVPGNVPYLVVFPADRSPPIVAHGPGTRVAVGASTRGPQFFGRPLATSRGPAFTDDGTLMFWCRTRDRDGVDAFDGLFAARLTLS
jgi:hypothetical protein